MRHMFVSIHGAVMIGVCSSPGSGLMDTLSVW